MNELQDITTPSEVDPSWKIGIVHAMYYKEYVGELIKGAWGVLAEAGIKKKNVTLHSVSGSFEIPLIGAALAEKEAVDALIGLGIIVQGETHHAHLIADQAARGIMDVQTRYRIPFAFEILYVDSLAQAQERCTGNANRGAQAASAVLYSLAQLKGLHS